MACSILLDAGRLFIRTLVLLLAFGLPFAALAQPIAVRDLAVLVDADGSETIASVSAPEAAQRFTPLDGLFSAGYTRKVHWLRFSVQAPAAGSWWLEVMPDPAGEQAQCFLWRADVHGPGQFQGAQ